MLSALSVFLRIDLSQYLFPEENIKNDNNTIINAEEDESTHNNISSDSTNNDSNGATNGNGNNEEKETTPVQLILQVRSNYIVKITN